MPIGLCSRPASSAIAFVELTGMPIEKAVVRPQGLLAAKPLQPMNATTARQRAARHCSDCLADARIVLAVGFADRRKGLDLFVEVGLELIERAADTFFVWVGHHEPGRFRRRERASPRPAPRRVSVFPGLVEDSDVFFAGADVYLMTSREDPFPLVVLHALDAELPVIGFDGAGGFVELLQRDCGVLVPYLDTTAMAEAVLRLLEDPADGRSV